MATKLKEFLDSRNPDVREAQEILDRINASSEFRYKLKEMHKSRKNSSGNRLQSSKFIVYVSNCPYTVELRRGDLLNKYGV